MSPSTCFWICFQLEQVSAKNASMQILIDGRSVPEWFKRSGKVYWVLNGVKQKAGLFEATFSAWNFKSLHVPFPWRTHSLGTSQLEILESLQWIVHFLCSGGCKHGRLFCVCGPALTCKTCFLIEQQQQYTHQKMKRHGPKSECAGPGYSTSTAAHVVYASNHHRKSFLQWDWEVPKLVDGLSQKS